MNYHIVGAIHSDKNEPLQMQKLPNKNDLLSNRLRF